MKRRFNPILAAVSVLLSQTAFANDETLSLRQLPNGDSQAVISGKLVGGCAPFRMNPLEAVERSGLVITVNSEAGGIPGICVPLIVPPQPYEVIAPLGQLSPGSYSVSWTTSGSPGGARQPFLAGVFGVSATSAIAVPATDAFALFVAAVGICIVAAGLTCRSTGRPRARLVSPDHRWPGAG